MATQISEKAVIDLVDSGRVLNMDELYQQLFNRDGNAPEAFKRAIISMYGGVNPFKASGDDTPETVEATVDEVADEPVVESTVEAVETAATVEATVEQGGVENLPFRPSSDYRAIVRFALTEGNGMTIEAFRQALVDKGICADLTKAKASLDVVRNPEQLSNRGRTRCANYVAANARNETRQLSDDAKAFRATGRHKFVAIEVLSIEATLPSRTASKAPVEAPVEAPGEDPVEALGVLDKPPCFDRQGGFLLTSVVINRSNRRTIK